MSQTSQAAPAPAAAPPRSAARIWIKLGLAAVLLGAAGYLLVVVRRQPTIGDIVQAPRQYAGRMVTVRGVVTAVVDVPVIQRGGYKIMDRQGGEILVVGGQLPKKGQTVRVRGEVKLPVESRLATVVYVQVKDQAAP